MPAITLRLLVALAALFAATPALAQAPNLTNATAGQRGQGVPDFTVRTGYKVTVALPQLNNARFMEFDSNGTLYVSQPDRGMVTSFRTKPDGILEKIADIVTGKRTVHGLCFYDGWLWFTTSGSVNKGKVRPDGSGLDDITAVIPDNGTLPKGAAHWWRSILVDADGFYTSVGEPNNITPVDESPDPLVRDREKIWHFALDGSHKQLFCSGIRNTEKLRHRPGTTEVWGCDHGSDNFGLPLGETTGRNQPVTDLIPGDELNLYEQGKFYGHPFIVGNAIPRIEFQSRKDILDIEKKTTNPAFLFGAHWANNGFTFITKDTFPGLKGDMLVAFHGSWNDATALVGYCIQRVMFDTLTGRPMGQQQIVGTIDPSGRPSLASPVDCVEAPDGTILFSVDTGVNRRGTMGAIYRISPADK